jgi:hypothetical protein
LESPLVDQTSRDFKSFVGEGGMALTVLRMKWGLYASKSRIANDRGKFKKFILDEASENIYLRQTFRGYIQGLAGCTLHYAS